MSNLVKRLRQAGDDLAGFDGSGGLYHQAADRIVELEADKLHRMKVCKERAERIRELKDDVKGWKRVYEYDVTKLKECITELEALLEARWNDILAVNERLGELNRAAWGRDRRTWGKEKTDE